MFKRLREKIRLITKVATPLLLSMDLKDAEETLVKMTIDMEADVNKALKYQGRWRRTDSRILSHIMFIDGKFRYVRVKTDCSIKVLKIGSNSKVNYENKERG